MKQITQANYDTVQSLAKRMGGRFVLNDGITIKQEPPEAMVKLAREIAAAQYSDDAAAITSGQWDSGAIVQTAIATLQHAVDVVKSAPVQRWETWQERPDGLVYRNAILTALGAAS